MIQMENIHHYAKASELLVAYEGARGTLTVPVSVDAIADFLNIKVVDDNTFDIDKIGEISFGAEGEGATVKIYTIENLQSTRRRFTLAHEIGHYCLHRSIGKKEFIDSSRTMSRSESYWDKNEAEANQFAAQLLMPKTLIISKGKELISQAKTKLGDEYKFPKSIFIENMAALFEVSKPAMEYRLKNLGIIG